MKTADEILREKWDQNCNNSYFDDMYVGERMAIEEAMKEYAIEVSKQTLINAMDNFNNEWYKSVSISTPPDRVLKSILNESNIPTL